MEWWWVRSVEELRPQPLGHRSLGVEAVGAQIESLLTPLRRQYPWAHPVVVVVEHTVEEVVGTGPVGHDMVPVVDSSRTHLFPHEVPRGRVRGGVRGTPSP